MLLFISGCSAPTYPKDKIYESLIKLCKEEYKVNVDAKVVGNTVAVYLPAEKLFDALFNIDPAASKKINNVILGISRVTISTDAKFDFYVVIAQDPQMPEIEIVYIRYVNDVKKFLLGSISRAEYSKRAAISIKTPPQAERERILKELFARLNIKDSEELIKEYAAPEETVSGISEISYWNSKFFIKEIALEEFLTVQIAERLKMVFREDRELNKWYEFKTAEGRFIRHPAGGSGFVFNISFADRVAPLYLDSGLELGAQQKRALVFKRLFGLVSGILKAYQFEDFTEVQFILPSEKKAVAKDKLWLFEKSRVKTEELI